MQYLKYIQFTLLSALIFLASLTNIHAAPQQLILPADTSTLPLSKLLGYQLAKQKCTLCHSVDYIRYQPPEMNQDQWTAEVAKMKNSYGAWLSNADIKSIGAYLAVVYGAAKVTDNEVLAASMAKTDDK